MASNSESSYPKKLILRISSSSCSPVLPTTPLQSPSPSTPPPPPPLFLKLSPNLIRSSSSLSPGLKLLYDKVFSVIPQKSPHLNPLGNFKSDNIRECIRLGCDIAFLNLVKKFQNLVDPSSFLSEVECFTGEIEEFEKLGYDVAEIRERFTLLKKRAEQEKALKDEVEKLEKEKKQKEEKLEEDETILVELAAETARVENEIKEQRSKIESIELNKRKIMEDSKLNAIKFKNLANSPW